MQYSIVTFENLVVGSLAIICLDIILVAVCLHFTFYFKILVCGPYLLARLVGTICFKLQLLMQH